MRSYEVKFQSHGARFRTDISQCTNPDCQCANLRCRLTEIISSGSPRAEPLVISFQVDPERWEETEPPARSAQETAIVEEFLRDYPEAQREEAREMARDKARIAKAIREYRLPARDCKEGALLPFSHVLAHPKRGLTNYAQWMHYFEHAGREYLIDDLYCCNPDCPCEEVNLLFHWLVPLEDSKEERSLQPLFQAIASFGGRAKLHEVFTGSKNSARRLLSAFWEQRGSGELDWYRKRYDWAKQIGARSLTPSASRPLRSFSRPAPEEPEEPERRAPRVGRNDPCPCGSGKKFKRCCGPKQRAAGS